MAERSESVEEQAVRDGSGVYLVEVNIAPAEDVPRGYKRTEVGVIPEDWAVKPVSDLASVKTGPFGSSLHERDYVEEGTPIVTVEHLGDYGLVHDNLPMVSEHDRKRLSRYELREGDIVFSRVGSVDRNSLISAGESGWLFSGRLLRVRVTNSNVHSLYLSYHFHSEAFKQRVRDVAVGQTMASLNTKILSGVLASIPLSGEEQRAIATALSDADALIESLDRLIAKKRAIKQAAMQQLLTGQTRLPGFPGEWETKRLGEFVSIRNEKVTPSAVHPETPCIELEHIGQGDGRLVTHSTAKHSTASKYQFRAGDVLFGRLRSYLRKYWLAKHSGICTTEIWPLVIDANRAVSGFLLGIVQSERFTEAASVSYGTHMPRADWKVLKNFEVKLPKIEEQTAIATILSDMDTEIEALERRRDKAHQIKQGMMQQLLTGRVRLVAPQSTEPVA